MSESNATLAIIPALPVSQLVAEQAGERPEAMAVAYGRGCLTYSELDRRANQVAHHLRTLGVGREKLVGLYLERSLDMIVAALGILKSGAAYLPLDPSMPAERLEFVLRDADVSAVITQKSLAGRLPSGSWPIVNVDLDRESLSQYSTQPLAVEIGLDDLAYVIYTSGSTGQPKGVEVIHAGLQNLIAWHIKAFGVTENDRASHQAALGFDAAVWELWPYLAAGASVRLIDEPVRGNPEKIRDWLVAQRITIAFLATPLAESIIRLDWPRDTALRTLLTGADTLHRRPSSKLPFVLVNNYGPTECTVVATSGVVSVDASNADTSNNERPSIGKAIDNITASIVDEDMRAVPAGTPGELCLAGPGLARGYRGQPALTAQKFVRNASVPGGRLYRTGDLARLLPNGEIQFLGRTDEQVKVRGYRVEPEEIVRALDQHSDVTTSAVVALEDGGSDRRLVAYLVTAAGSNLTAGLLRSFLQTRLPDYMIPAAFVNVESLPLTSNGKVDRAALPAPTDANVIRETAYVAPSGIVEERLAAIIGPLLHVDRVGANDNFFLLGGHSLLGTQLVTRIGEAFGVELSLLSLFDHPTLAGMAREIERLAQEKIESMSPQDVLQALLQGDAGNR
jgi:amino acid adenylation domain-containing protein